MTTLPRKTRRLAIGISATLARIAIVFSVLLIVNDALQRLASQLAPASWWFELSRVTIQPGGTVAIVYRSSRVDDLPLSGITELIGPDGDQPCTFATRRVIEKGTTYAVVPTQRLLPDCDWLALSDGEYALQMTMSFAAPGNFVKAVTVHSDNKIIMHGGRIAGATPLPPDD